MSQATNHMETLVLYALVNGLTAQFSNAKPYIGLLTSAPTDSSAGTEVSGGSYARVQVGGTGQSDFNVSNDGQASNADEFRWPDATANWGQVTHVALYDSATGGNMLLYGTLSSAVNIASGDIFKIPPSGFTINMD